MNVVHRGRITKQRRPKASAVLGGRATAPYLQAGSPSAAVVTVGLGMFTPTPQAKPAGICVCDTVACHPPACVPVPSTTVGVETLVELLNFRPAFGNVVYLE